MDGTFGNGRLWMAIPTLWLCACGGLSSSGSDGPSLHRNWIAEPAIGALGVALDVKSDGSYVITNLTLTSQTTANAIVESGTLTVSGSTITFTPKEWSCRGPRPVWSAPFSFQDGDLLITQPTYVLKLQPTNATATTSFALAIGCTDNSGKFMPEALAPVSN
ncbi:MAG TPA: hypothetical protein VGY54_11775 [Polyangiaceae bacterium]|nr:hypothetical protein [Polyangiaceae bacterium]